MVSQSWISIAVFASYPAQQVQICIGEAGCADGSAPDVVVSGRKGTGPALVSSTTLQRGSLRSLVAHSTARVKASTASLALRALRTLSLAVNYNHLVWYGLLQLVDASIAFPSDART